MAVPLSQFVRELVASGVMSRDQVRAFEQRLPAEKRQPDDAQPFARELIRHKLLTVYQARCVYQGKSRDLVLGNYVKLDELGKGGMGKVFKAEHRRMKRIVALKVMSQAAMEFSDAEKRFQREVQAAAKLTHSNIVAAFDADQAHGVHFLVMEYVEGSDLASLVYKSGVLSVPRAVEYVEQAARGLGHAHAQGVVHRDVKPANLLVDRHGIVKVLDMGLARIDETLSGSPATGLGLTQSGSIMGTVDYMSPEQALNTKYADHRSDIYSLGCVLYFLLTGKSVYSGASMMESLLAHRERPIPSLSSANVQVPAQLDAVFAKMIAKHPDERYQSMSEVLRDLEGLATGAPGAPPLDAGQTGDDAALREFAAAVSPAASAPRWRTRARESGGEGATRGAGAGPRTSFLDSAVKRISNLSQRQRLLLVGGAAAVTLIILILVSSPTQKPISAETSVVADAEHEKAAPPGGGDRNRIAAGGRPKPGVGEQQAAGGKAEKPPDAARWKSLFDGKTLAGWSIMGGGQWRAEGGILATLGDGKGWLMSDAEFADFELELEYKLPPAGNSGVFLRAWPEGDVSGGQFLEIQLLDDAAPAYQSVAPAGRTGAIFGTAAPNPAPRAPVAEWHRLRIVATGRFVKLIINGQQVLEANLDEYQSNVGKFPGLAREGGRLGLQNYGPGVEFRRIRIRDLSKMQPSSTLRSG